jgi:hypothetical protein
MEDVPNSTDSPPGFFGRLGRRSYLFGGAPALLAGVLIAGIGHVQETSAATRTPTLERAAARVIDLPEALRSSIVLTSIDCVDRNYCIAVGVSLAASDTGGAPGYWPTGMPVIVRFNGHTWSGVASPSLNSAGLNGVSCVSRTSCVAVGEQASSDGDGSTLIEQYSGTGWKVVPSPDSSAFPRNSNFLQSVSCSSAGECVAVGGNNNVYAGRAEEYTPIVVSESNEAWVIDSIASPTDGHFTSVSCSLMKCVTVGDGTASDIQANGGEWAPIERYASGLSGVVCRTSCTGVGQSTRGAGISVARLVGMKWTRVSAPKTSNPTATNTLSSVSCFDDRSCVAVGQFIGSESITNTTKSKFGPLIATEAHGKWSEPPAVSLSSENEPWLFSVSCPSTHVCLAVGTTLIDAIHAPNGGYRSLAVLIQH